VILLLDKGAYISNRHEENITAFHESIWRGYKEIALALLEKGVDINTKGRYEKTALHYAAEMGHKEIALVLLEKGADIDAKDLENNTALYYATKEGHNETALTLLEKGADFTFKNKENKSFLDKAFKNNLREVLETIFFKSNEITFPENNIIFHISPKFKILKECNKRKLSFNKKNDKGYNGLHSAVIHDNEDAVKFLLEWNKKQKKENRIDINEIDGEGNTILLLAYEIGNPRIIQLLENQKGIDFHHKNFHEMGIGEITIQRGRVDLLKKRKKIELKDKFSCNYKFNDDDSPSFEIEYSCSPLGLALVEFGWGPTAEYLYKNGYTKLAGQEIFPLIQQKSISLFETLKKKKVKIDFNASLENGKTPLMFTCELKDKEMVEKKKKNGADKDLKDKEGKRAIDYTDDEEIRKLLR
ncbi:MAG: ankyrin repeat domain-containing protein, partial [Leptospiraceae bacterium]|nr:ankyrin repeat domain-containing protein [Leptospiraceae bacterium]